MTIPSFITVRTQSTRLPNKCLLPFGDYNVLEHIIFRTKLYGLEPIVCTTIDSSDDIIEAISKKENIKFFRGSIINKLKRWLDCCNHFQIEAFHTVDADDPFFDGNEMIRSYMLLKEEDYDVVCPTKSSSDGAATVGYSLTKKIISKACDLIEDSQDTEMIWNYINRIKNLKKTILSESNSNTMKVRLTLDYQEDYWLLQTVRRILGNECDRKEVENLFRANPDLYRVNWFRNREWAKRQKITGMIK